MAGIGKPGLSPFDADPPSFAASARWEIQKMNNNSSGFHGRFISEE
jgi:hypothetical protein